MAGWAVTHPRVPTRVPTQVFRQLCPVRSFRSVHLRHRRRTRSALLADAASAQCRHAGYLRTAESSMNETSMHGNDGRRIVVPRLRLEETKQLVTHGSSCIHQAVRQESMQTGSCHDGGVREGVCARERLRGVAAENGSAASSSDSDKRAPSSHDASLPAQCQSGYDFQDQSRGAPLGWTMRSATGPDLTNRATMAANRHCRRSRSSLF